MPATWSTWACTVEASRVRTRSTAVLARPLAMAEPLDVNSAVRLVRSDWTEIVHVRAARGTRMRSRNNVILARRPNRPDHQGAPSARLARGDGGSSTGGSLVGRAAGPPVPPPSFLFPFHCGLAALAPPPPPAFTPA